MKLQFDFEKAIFSLKYILTNFEDYTTDFHKVFKILYFAEQKHLSRFGRSITGDRYIAMKNGPVPSNVYDIFKILKGESILKFNSNIDVNKEFKVINEYSVQLLDKNFDIEMFSETEQECLTQSIEENKFLDFNTLTDKSHDAAWCKTTQNDVMSPFQIALAAGANDEMLKYISLNIENSSIGV